MAGLVLCKLAQNQMFIYQRANKKLVDDSCDSYKVSEL